MTLLTGWKVQIWKTSVIDFFFQKPKSFLKTIKLPVFIIIIIIKDFTVIINKG